MPRGGARPNSGPKKKLQVAPIRDRGFAARVLSRVGELELKTPEGKPIRNDEDYSLNLLRDPYKGGAGEFTRLREKRDGKAPQTINYQHDKPVEMHVTLSMSERMRVAMEKAEARVRNRG